ncbi:hypothetical protein HMPREF9062_1697 [Actinomyces sp. oral taxon 448 str. F0400]|nr:hypothetical protein HMPREF9062_1697 [Actinomyces sp. oral taxon 448 str. F0400]
MDAGDDARPSFITTRTSATPPDRPQLTPRDNESHSFITLTKTIIFYLRVID